MVVTRSRDNEADEPEVPVKKSRKSQDFGDDFGDEEGDITIKAADGKVLKVKAYHLQASSPVFRDMMALGGESNTIEFVCQRLERRSNLQAIFDLVAGKAQITPYRISQIPCIVQFLQKYDMQRELEVVRLQIVDGVHGAPGRTSLLRLFVAAAWIADHRLCGKILELHGGRSWSGLKEQGEFGRTLAGGKVFDPTVWSREFMDALPKDPLWALIRASRTVNWSRDTVSQHRAMADEFVRLMKSKQEPKRVGAAEAT